MNCGTIYKTNGEKINVTPKNSTDFQLEELNTIVDGYIEIIYLNDGKIMVVNEEGKLIGLELNVQASLLARQPIVGNVLVCPTELIK